MNSLLIPYIEGWLRSLHLPDPDFDYSVAEIHLDVAFPDDHLGLRMDEQQQEITIVGWTIWSCVDINQAHTAFTAIAQHMGIEIDYPTLDLSDIKTMLEQGLLDKALTTIRSHLERIPKTHPEYEKAKGLETRVRNAKRRVGSNRASSSIDTSSKFVSALKSSGRYMPQSWPSCNFLGFFNSSPYAAQDVDAVWTASNKSGTVDIWAATAAGNPAQKYDVDFEIEPTAIDLLRRTLVNIGGALTFIWDDAEVMSRFRAWHYRSNGSDLPSALSFIDLRAICLVAWPTARRSDQPEALCRELKIAFDDGNSGAHNPLAAMIALIMACVKQFSVLDDPLRAVLRKAFQRTALEAVWLDVILSPIENTSDPDAYRKLLIKHYEQLSAPIQFSNGDRSVNGLEVNDFFREGGFLDVTQDGAYRIRAGQIGFAQRISEALYMTRPCLLEAGTGIGKTIGYLVPLLLHDGRSFVATRTKNLQDQAWLKDIPTVLAAFEQAGIGRVVSILKGKSNYFSPQALENAFDDLNDTISQSDERAFTFASVLHWAVSTSTAHLSEIEALGQSDFLAQFSREKTSPTESEVWATIDPYRRAVEASRNADLVIVNHSLVLALANMAQPEALGVDTIVFDEAHNLEEVVTDTLTLNFDGWMIREQIDVLLDRDMKGRVRGLLKAVFEHESLARDPLLTQFQDTLLDISNTVDEWNHVCAQRCAEIGKPRRESDDESPILFDAMEFWTDQLHTTAQQLAYKLNSLLLVLDPVIDKLPALRGLPWRLIDRIRGSLRALSEQTIDSAEALQAFLTNDPEWVRWGEATSIYTNNKQLMLFEMSETWRGVLHSTPLDVVPWLKETLPSLYPHRIYVSATLAIGSNFSNVIARLGLSDDDATTEIFSSPYNLREQALLVVPTDLPYPQANSDFLYIEALSASIAELSQISGGQALALFTSRKTMNEVMPRLQALLGDSGIVVLVQRTHNRSALTERFRSGAREGEKLVLLGLRAFWEGVDFPGALKLLIISRLPFDFSGHPVAAARRIHYLSQEFDRDYFREVVLPTTLLHLRQMVGRLIRREEDRGVCVIADPRIQGRQYGRYIFNMLDGQKAIGKHVEVSNHVREFLANRAFDKDMLDLDETRHENTDLSLEQQAVIQSPARRMMVEATAGSGKTRTLVERIARLIGSGLAKTDEILVLTFTNKAKNVMMERLESRLDAEAVLILTRNVLTYHRFASRVIRTDDNDKVRFLDEHQDEQTKIIQLARKVAHLSRRELSDEDAMTVISFAQNGLVDENELKHDIPNLTPPVRQLARFFLSYVAELRKAGQMDYGETIVQAVKRLRENVELRQSWSSRFKWILCDEYQDTTPAQAALIGLIAQNANILVVGDSAQSIYSWQGADTTNLHRFAEDFPDTASFTLSKNFRGFPNLVRTAEYFLRNVDQFNGMPIGFDERRDTDLNKVHFLTVADEDAEARAIVEMAAEAYRMRLTVGILARKWSLLADVETECIRREIPYRFEGESALGLAAHPTLKQVIERALNLLQESTLSRPTGDSLYSQVVSDLRNGRVKSAGALLQKTAEMLGHPEQQFNAQIEFDHFTALWNDKHPDAFLAFYGDHERDAEPIVLSTIHSQKGAEFDTVFVLGLERGNTPNTPPLLYKRVIDWQRLVRRLSHATWRASLTHDDVQSTYEQEEARIFYVAMTRAIGNLVVCRAESRGERSPFLDFANLQNAVDNTTLPSELVRVVDTRSEAAPAGYRSNERTYLTNAGIRVRSKSEMLLANEFHRRGMYFEYEVPIDGISAALPDFTFPDYGRIILEHVGLMDDPAYRRRWEAKVQQYRDRHIRFFYTTEENVKNPIVTVDELQRQFAVMLSPERIAMIQLVELIRRQSRLSVGRMLGDLEPGLFRIDNHEQYVALFIPPAATDGHPAWDRFDGVQVQWNEFAVGGINGWIASYL